MDALARRAAEHFAEMTEEMDEETVLEIVRKLETAACSDEPGAMIALLGTIFRQNGMEFATAEMEALDYCISEVPDACEAFADSFFDDGYVDWYCVEGWLRDIGNGKIISVAAQQIGNRGGQKFWSWYGFHGRVEWCACFVSWCSDQCGYIKAGIMSKSTGVGGMISFYKIKHQWQTRSYKPSAGDVIFFDWGGDGSPDHVGLVEKCDGRIAYTIEGNSSDTCRRRNYPVGGRQIFGYGIPKY